MFYIIKLCIHAKLNCLKQADYLYKNGFGSESLT